MAFTKFASFEVSEILDVKGSPDQVKTASLSKLADFEEYRTEDGYLYARIRAISSRVNKNHDGWPSVELAGSQDVFDRHQSSEGGFTVEASKDADFGFSTFLGKPVFVDHHNSDPSKARGVVVDAKLHVEDHKTAAGLDPYYAAAPDNHMPPTWVELLLEIDANSFPKLAKAIIDGSNDAENGIDGFSMGCDVRESKCNICDNKASTPDDFCDHVRMKGAHFDYTDDRTGEKTSKKAYEDCYGIKFFELSAVFDPADETALLREIRSSVNNEDLENGLITTEKVLAGAVTNEMIRQGSVTAAKLAENALPQADLVHAPKDINTLREERICPVCGSEVEEETCDVCGHVFPPEGFDNPDLEKAKEEQPDIQEIGQEQEDAFTDPELPGQQPQPAPPTIPGTTAHVKSDMGSWKVSVHPRVAAKINHEETPIKADSTQPQSDEPNFEQIVNDPQTPVTSRTAQDMIKAAGRNNQEEHMSNQKVAAEPLPGTAADKRVDVVGTGGVADASNEAASQADAQVGVTDKGSVLDGSNQEASSPSDGTESLPTAGEESDDSGFNTDKNIEKIPTKTFPQGDQHDPIAGPAFPTSHTHDAAKEGVKPEGGPDVQPSKRIDLESTDGWDNPGTDTDQWTGTDGNGVTRQQEPVTNEASPHEGLTSHIVACFKLADIEVDMGLLPKEQKFERIAELEGKSPDHVEASLAYAAKVKTAGFGRQEKVATKLPSMRNTAKVSSTTRPNDLTLEDSALFG